MCEKCKKIEELIRPRLNYFREAPSNTVHTAWWHFTDLAAIERILAKTDKDTLIGRGVIK